ncbi:MAG: FAD-binding protein [Anaerolineae bacterium]
MDAQQNWAGNLTYSAAQPHRPTTVQEIQSIVKNSSKVKALGTRHSFNTIADTPDDLISLERLNQVVALDRERRTVTVEAGMKYGDLGVYLHSAGYALHNMASLPHISVAGACATATHGSGDQNGNLATAVAALELVTGEGEVVTLSREGDGDTFQGAVVGLGALGVVTKMTLDVVPTFAVRQEVYENLPRAQLDAHLDEIMSSAYSVSLLNDWQPDRVNLVWLKRLVTADTAPEVAPQMFGATLAAADRHPIAELSAENCTPQMGVPGPWHERLPHFRMGFTPSNGEELQTEYFVPRQHAVAALRAVTDLREGLAPLLQISEIRTVAADTLWLSPCYRQPCVAIHFTWWKDWAGVAPFLPTLEASLAPFDARPHWGKLFAMPTARVQALYARLPDFRRLAQSLDPRGKFRNAFLDRYIFGEENT